MKATIIVYISTKIVSSGHILNVDWSVISVEFGEKLKELRMQAGLTQRIGLTKSVVSFYELRERSPSPDVLMKLSAIFHVSTDYLLGVEKKEMLDVSGLTASQITAVLGIIAEYRKANNSAV